MADGESGSGMFLALTGYDLVTPGAAMVPAPGWDEDRPPSGDLPILTLGPAQPEPLAWHVAPSRNAAGWVTAIGRVWPVGSAARCRLCPRGECTADRHGDHEFCVVQVQEYVPDAAARLYSTVGRPRLDA